MHAILYVIIVRVRFRPRYTSAAQMFSDPANLDPAPGFDPIGERLGDRPPLAVAATAVRDGMVVNEVAAEAKE